MAPSPGTKYTLVSTCVQDSLLFRLSTGFAYVQVVHTIRLCAGWTTGFDYVQVGPYMHSQATNACYIRPKPPVGVRDPRADHHGAPGYFPFRFVFRFVVMEIIFLWRFGEVANDDLSLIRMEMHSRQQKLCQLSLRDMAPREEEKSRSHHARSFKF